MHASRHGLIKESTGNKRKKPEKARFAAFSHHKKGMKTYDMVYVLSQTNMPTSTTQLRLVLALGDVVCSRMQY